MNAKRHKTNNLLRESIVALLVGCGVVGAGAHPAATQEEARTMTTTGETSSPCVGDPRTPLCALDTWNACFLWTEPQLCERVGLEGVDFREDEIGSTFEREHTFRRIAVRPIEARHLAEIEAGPLTALAPELEWFRAGYIEMRWTQQACRYVGDDRCFTYDAEGVLIVKPVGDAWHVSGWQYGGDASTCRDYAPARDDPWRRHCSLHIPTGEFLAYEASRRSAE